MKYNKIPPFISDKRHNQANTVTKPPKKHHTIPVDVLLSASEELFTFLGFAGYLALISYRIRSLLADKMDLGDIYHCFCS